MSTVVKNPSNNQEVFDFVVAALRKQDAKSIDENGACYYRGQNGLKCAAGHLIPDEDYRKEWEGKNLLCGLGQYLIDNGYNWSFVRDLQLVHDCHEVDKWEDEFKILAKKYKLSYTQPEAK